MNWNIKNDKIKIILRKVGVIVDSFTNSVFPIFGLNIAITIFKLILAVMAVYYLRKFVNSYTENNEKK